MSAISSIAKLSTGLSLVFQTAMLVWDSSPTNRLPVVAYSPNTWMTTTFFALNIGLQGWWLSDCWPAMRPVDTSRLPEDGDAIREKVAEKEQHNETAEESSGTAYCPVFILGNLFTVLWSVAWMQESFTFAQVTLILNGALQFFAIFGLLAVPRRVHDIPIKNDLTHILLRANAGLATLYMWKTWGAVDKLTSPSIPEQFHCALVFLLLTIASGPGPTLGICLLYVLVALSFGEGHNQGWRDTFPWIGLLVLVAMILDRAFARRKLASPTSLEVVEDLCGVRMRTSPHIYRKF